MRTGYSRKMPSLVTSISSHSRRAVFMREMYNKRMVHKTVDHKVVYHYDNLTDNAYLGISKSLIVCSKPSGIRGFSLG